MKLPIVLKTLLASLALLAAHAVLAQSFPSKPINMIVAFPAAVHPTLWRVSCPRRCRAI